MQGWSHISVLAPRVDCAARVPCAPVDPTEIPHDQTTPAATAADDSGKPRGAIVICSGLQRREIPFELIVSNAIASMEPRALGRGAGGGHRNCAPFSGLEPNADEAPMGTRFHTHTHNYALSPHVDSTLPLATSVRPAALHKLSSYRASRSRQRAPCAPCGFAASLAHVQPPA